MRGPDDDDEMVETDMRDDMRDMPDRLVRGEHESMPALRGEGPSSRSDHDGGREPHELVDATEYDESRLRRTG